MPVVQTEVHRRAFALADQLGLTRDERIEYAEMFLKRDCVSWKSLTEADIRRVVDGLESFALLTHLLQMRQ